MTSVLPRLDRSAAAASVSSICMLHTTPAAGHLFPPTEEITWRADGYGPGMTVLVILVILALIFGIGAVLEGLAWAFLIGFVLLVAAAWWGWTKVRGAAGRR